jgi:hypothetical protein
MTQPSKLTKAPNTCIIIVIIQYNTIQFHNTTLPFTGQKTIGSETQSDLLMMGVKTLETC